MSVCPSCGHGYPVGAKFCAECGAALPEAVRQAEAERKTVTALFADLVGFTSMGYAEFASATSEDGADTGV